MKKKNTIVKGKGLEAQIKSAPYKEIKTQDGLKEVLDALTNAPKAKLDGGGLRYNDDKVGHDLLEPFAINELAKVFTAGAKKYAPNNWLRGMKWSTMIGCLKRHINAFERGEDFDPETGLYHMAHAAWNAMALISYYRYHPKMDDRFKVRDIPRVGFDIDEVLAKFVGQYDKHYKTGIPSSWNFDKQMPERLKKHSKDKKFWMDIEPHLSGHDLPIEPVVYITARPIDSSVTEAWLKKHNFPVAPVVTVAPGTSKVDVVREYKLDIFVDDNYKTFCEINDNTNTLCYLMAAEHNKRYIKQAGHLRIKSLKEIL